MQLCMDQVGNSHHQGTDRDVKTKPDVTCLGAAYACNMNHADRIKQKHTDSNVFLDSSLWYQQQAAQRAFNNHRKSQRLDMFWCNETSQGQDERCYIGTYFASFVHQGP